MFGVSPGSASVGAATSFGQQAFGLSTLRLVSAIAASRVYRPQADLCRQYGKRCEMTRPKSWNSIGSLANRSLLESSTYLCGAKLVELRHSALMPDWIRGRLVARHIQSCDLLGGQGPSSRTNVLNELLLIARTNDNGRYGRSL